MRNRGILSHFIVACVVVTGLEQAPAYAQAPAPASNTATQTQPAPGPDRFSGSATVSVSLESGRTDLNAAQLSLQGRKPYATGGALTTAASYTRATTRPPGSSESFTVADRLSANVGIEHDYGKRLVMMVRTQALRDPVAQIGHRVEQIGGLGVRLGTNRVQLRVVPGLSFLHHDKNIETENGFNTTYGFYQDAIITLTPAWKLTQWMYASEDFVDHADYVLSFDANVTGAITRRLGVQLSYHYSFERLQPPGVEPRYQKALVGLQLRF